MSFDTAIRTAFQKGSTAYGYWVTLPGAVGVRVVLRAAAAVNGGFSWALIDAEHGQITDADYYELVNACGREGVSPIIRVPWNEEWMIKRALDAGAHGVLTPMCHNAEDAARIVSYSKYPPIGSRGYGPMFSTHAMPGVSSGAQHDTGADNSLVVAVQIESQQGIDNVDAIAAVPGLDVLLIGPFDLAKQMKVTHGGAEHEAAIQKTLEAAKKAGKTAAIFCSNGAQAAARVAQGFDMVSIVPDCDALATAMSNELKVAQGVDGAKSQGGKGY